MPPKDCRVVMTDPQGIRRSVRVTAETLFEAAALAVYAFPANERAFNDLLAPLWGS